MWNNWRDWGLADTEKKNKKWEGWIYLREQEENRIARRPECGRQKGKRSWFDDLFRVYLELSSKDLFEKEHVWSVCICDSLSVSGRWSRGWQNRQKDRYRVWGGEIARVEGEGQVCSRGGVSEEGSISMLSSALWRPQQALAKLKHENRLLKGSKTDLSHLISAEKKC